mmetsp:Transcript_104385/g.179860  ORF Transcript_104385/g.179860 Transcript_104385/m.179860 type:complete len:472 (-) Transcript_104385:1344-2759(-)
MDASADDIERRSSIFKTFDTDGDGYVNEDDFRRGLRAIGCPVHCGHITHVMTKIVSNERGFIDFDRFNEFCEWNERHLRAQFDRFDTKKMGVLSVSEMKQALREAGVEVSSHEIAILNHIEGTMHGHVDFHEWRRLFMFVPFDRAGCNLWCDMWQRQSRSNVSENDVMPVDYSLSPLVSFLAGALSGIVSRTLTAPLERLKVLAQLRGSGVELLPQRWGIISGMRVMIQEGGVTSLFRGNLANCLKVAPQGGVQWTVFQYLKQTVGGHGSSSNNMSPHLRFLCGAGAGITSQAAIYPLETVKTRLSAAPTGFYKGIIHCMRTVVQADGIRGLYRGLGTALIGRIPYSGVDLTVYETLKYSYLNYYESPREQAPIHVMLLCGTLSTASGQICAYPFALSRSLLQTQGMHPGQPVQYHGLLDCVRATIRLRGFRGLYAGLYANLVQCLPASGIGYVTYEKGKVLLGAYAPLWH